MWYLRIPYILGKSHTNALQKCSVRFAVASTRDCSKETSADVSENKRKIKRIQHTRFSVFVVDVEYVCMSYQKTIRVSHSSKMLFSFAQHMIT